MDMDLAEKLLLFHCRLNWEKFNNEQKKYIKNEILKNIDSNNIVFNSMLNNIHVNRNKIKTK